MKTPRNNYPFTLDDIIPHLKKVRWIKQTTPRKLLACCPAHDDKNPSLSLSETPDGKPLWYCHATCSQREVQEALEKLAGVQRTNRYRKREQPTTAQPLTLDMLAQAKRLVAVKLYEWGVRTQSDGTVAIPYFARDGFVSAVQFRKALTGDDRFVWRSGDTVILYGLWRINEWDTADTLYLCEGTSDTWTMWSADYPALGIPGAKVWKSDWWKELEEFQRIVLVADTDSAGGKLVEKLYHTVPMELSSRVYVLRLPDGVKDVNELWIRENADVEQFKRALAGCKVEPLMDVSLEDEANELEFVWGYERERDTAHTIVPNLLYAERITILAGEAGVGKTTFALEIADALTRTGKLWNGTVEVQPAKVMWLDFDHDWGRLREILEAYYGNNELQIIVPKRKPETLNAETLPKYRRWIEKNGVDLIVADTAFDWLDVQDGNDETEARVKLQLIRELIAGTGCGVLLLHHPRKTVGDGGRTTALAGSHRFAAKVDVVAFLVPVNRDGMDVVKLIVAKDRDGERLELELQRVSRKFLPLQRNAVPTGEWGVVKAYLQQHGGATYKELLEALTQAGIRIHEKTFQKRVKRWEKRGMVMIEKRGGYPQPKAIVKLPIVSITPFGKSTIPSGDNGDYGDNGDNGDVGGSVSTTTTSREMGEVVEHTDSLWYNSGDDGDDGDVETLDSSLADGSIISNISIFSNISNISTMWGDGESCSQRDMLEAPETTNGDVNSQSGGADEPLQQFTVENNPPEPTTVPDGGLSSLTIPEWDNQPTQHNPATVAGVLSDSTHNTDGGIEMMNRTNRNSTVDSDTLFRTALQVGFPRFTVVNNGNRLDVDGSYAGWKTALPTLAKENVMREAYLALNRCKPRKETQPVVVKITPDGFSFSTTWRVEVVSIERIDDGKRLRWTFRTVDDNRTITAITKYSTEPDSKLARWITVLTREPNPPIDTLDLSQLVGKVADGIIVHKQSPDGDGEQLELFNLVRVKRYTPPTITQAEAVVASETVQQPETEPQVGSEPQPETEQQPATAQQLVLPEPFHHRNPLAWDMLDESFRDDLYFSELEQIRLLLAYAELNDYPELTVPDLNYTIRGSMGGWITAVKHFAGTPTIELLAQQLASRTNNIHTRESELWES